MCGSGKGFDSSVAGRLAWPGGGTAALWSPENGEGNAHRVLAGENQWAVTELTAQQTVWALQDVER